MKRTIQRTQLIFKSLLLIVVTTLFYSSYTYGQTTFTVSGSGTTNSYLYSAMYTFNAAPRYIRMIQHFPASQLALGTTIPNNALLSSIGFERNSTTGALAGTPNLKIYLQNRVSSSTDLGAGTLTWSTEITGATLVYDGNPTSIVGSTSGWKTFAFGVGSGAASSFTYTGGALVMFYEYTQGTAPATTINWNYETAATATPTSSWTTNSTKYTVNSTATLPTTVATSSANHIRTQFTYTTGGCTAPPTAGTATTTLATTCSGSNITLNLTGNSSGTGQTYQWESSPTVGGTYTSVGGSLSSPSLTIAPTATAYYRCVVTCSGNAQTSSSVLVSVNPPLAGGIYTINSLAPTAGNNFQTFSAAISALSCGIAGPVVFDVHAGSGPYNEQIDIPAIAGSSSVNTITFNGNNTTLTYDASASSYYATLNLSGADYITFNDLNVIGTGATNAFGIHLMSSSDNNNFVNCTSTVNTTSTSTATQAMVLNASNTTYSTGGSGGNNNTFTNCTFTGGYYGVVFYGSSTAGNTGNTFVGCSFEESYAYSTYHLYTTGLTIRDCIFERPTRTSVTTGAGVYFTTGCANNLIERNRVRNLFGGATSSTTTGYGFACIIAASAGNENKYYNNLVYNMVSNGPVYGMYFSGGSYIKAYHNTISLDNTSSTATGVTYGIYTTGTSGNDFKNNIVTISRGGTGTKACVYLASTTGNLCDYNDLYMNAAAGTNYIGSFSGTGQTTFNLWKSSNSSAFDQHSFNVNPIYLNTATGNYAPSVSTLNNAGVNLSVATDITGASRSSTPDIGAYEYNVAATDIGVWSIVTPGAGGCYNNNETVTIQIKNYGLNQIDFSTDPTQVDVAITGPIATTITDIINSGVLASGAIMNYTLTSGTANLSSNGAYTINAFTTCASDGNSSNDAVTPVVVNSVPLVAGSINSSSNNICYSSGVIPVFSLSGNAGGNGYQWQESTVSSSGPWTTVGGNTATYTPSSVPAQTTFVQMIASCYSNSSTSAVFTENVNAPLVTSTTPGSVCGYGPVNLSASGSSTQYNWYSTSTSVTPLSTGTGSFTTPAISTNTNFYVAASSGGINSSLGLANRVGATTNSGYADIGLMFDALQPFTLTSVAMYPVATTPSGNVTATIALKDAAGTILQSTTVAIPTAVSPGVKNTIPLNFLVPAGTGMRLVLTAASGGGITGFIRESATGYTYPYTIAGVASITSAYTSGASASYYYYFYDWNISTECTGPRVAVLASITPAPALSIIGGDQDVCFNTVATLATNASAATNYSSLTWSPASDLFTDLACTIPYTTGTNAPTVYYKSSSIGTTAYSCTANSNSGCNNIATVNITNLPASITLAPVQSNMCLTGSTAIAIVPVSTYGNSIVWQDSPNGTSYTTISGANASTYTTPTLSSSTYYKAELFNSTGASCASANTTINVNNPQLIAANGATICGNGSMNLTATVNSGYTANWYAAPSGGSSLHTGTTFTTPALTTTTTYYVTASSAGVNGNVGLPATTGSISSGIGVGTYGIFFDALSDFSLNAVTIYPNAATNGTSGSVTIGLYNNAGTLLQSTVVSVIGYVQSTTPTPQTVNLNWNIQTGTNYRIAPVSITGISGLMFQAACTGCWSYPYTISGVVSLTSSTYSGALHPELYYYFYNWSVSNNCETARTPVIATVTSGPTISASTTLGVTCSGAPTTLNVSSANSNFTYTWMPGNLTGNSINVSPTTSTTYTVTAVDNVIGSPSYSCTAVANVPIAVQPATATVSAANDICVSGSTVLSLIPSTGYQSGTIQWQSSSTNSSYTNVSGATNTSVTTPVLTSSMFYKAVIVDGNNAVCLQPYDTALVNNPQIISTTPASICGSGAVTLSATASNGSTIKWYSAATGGLPISTGASFSPTITTTTTYYVAASSGSTIANMGLANRVGTTQNTGYSDVGLMFDAVQAFNLVSVAIYPVNSTPGNSGSITIALKNSAGTILSSTTVNNIVTTVAPGVKTIIPLNFSVPIGTGMRLVVTAASGLTGLTREATTGYTYPYTLSGVASITSAYTSGASSAYYYYFYDWEVTTGCESGRSPVIATSSPAPTITSSTTNASTCNSATTTLSVTSSNTNYTYTWMPGGLTGSSVNVNPSTTTTYTVNAIDNVTGSAYLGCTSFDTKTIQVQPAAISVTASDVICVSGAILMSLSPSSGYASGGSIQWQNSSNNSTYTTISGANGTSYTTPNLTSTMYYQAVLKDGLGNVCTSSYDTAYVNNPQPLTVTPGYSCGVGTVTLNATPPTGGSISWYTSSNGGNPVGTGNTFVTPTIGTNTTYYAEASYGQGIIPLTGSPANPTFGGNSPSSSNIAIGTQAMYFNVTGGPATIYSVDIYPTAAVGSTFSIEIRNSAGTTIFTTGNLLTTVTGGATPQTVVLNATIPVGTQYKFGMGTNPGLQRNTTGAVYPYTTGNFSMTGNTFNVVYWYWFYNIKISSGCSGTRVPVLASVLSLPTSTLSLNGSNNLTIGQSTTLAVNLTGTGPWTYTLNDGSSHSAATSPDVITVTPLVSYIYSVTSLNDLTCSTSNSALLTGAATVTVHAINDSCINATPLTVSSACNYISGTSINGHLESSPSTCLNSNADDDVWYSFYKPAGMITTTIKVLGGANYDPAFEVLSGSCNSMVSVYCQNNSNITTNNTETANVGFPQAAGTYLVRVNDARSGAGSGNFSICVSGVIPAPLNDDPCGSISVSTNSAMVGNCSNTVVAAYDNGNSCYNGVANSPTTNPPIGPNLVYYTGTTAYATTMGASEPTPPCGVPGATPKSIWYKFKAPTMGGVSIDLRTAFTGNPTTFNTIIALYAASGNPCSVGTTYTPIACSSNGSLNVSAIALAPYGASGQDLYVQLIGQNSTFGNYMLSLQGTTQNISVANPTSGSLQVTFPTVTNASSIRLYWRPVSGTGYSVISLNPSTSTYTIAGLQSGVNYRVWAAFVNSNQVFYTQWQTLSTTFGCTGAPTSPTVTAIAGHCSRVKVKWPNHSSATSSLPYRLYYRVVGSSGFNVVACTTDSFFVNNLALNTNYEFFYRVICTGGNQINSLVATYTTCAGPAKQAGAPLSGNGGILEHNGRYLVDVDFPTLATYADNTVADGNVHEVNLSEVNNIDLNGPDAALVQAVNIEEGMNGSFNLIPNPTNGNVTIDYALANEGDVMIRITDVQGKVVKEQLVSDAAKSGSVQIDLTEMNSGVYLVNVRGTGYNETKRLVVTK